MHQAVATIPSPREAGGRGPMSDPVRVALVVAGAHTLNDMYASFVPPLLPRIMGELGLSITLAATDRKSTRLNSSHRT